MGDKTLGHGLFWVFETTSISWSRINHILRASLPLANVFHNEEICHGLKCDLSEYFLLWLRKITNQVSFSQNELVLDKFILATGSKFLLSVFTILIPASLVHFSWFTYDLPILTSVL